VLGDGNLPSEFAPLIVGHETRTIHSQGWSDLSNGELLRVASGKFDVLVTLDQSLQFQQNLPGYELAVVILRARSNRLVHLVPLVPELLRNLLTAPRGQATIVGA